jgi:hypothetical protein
MTQLRSCKHDQASGAISRISFKTQRPAHQRTPTSSSADDLPPFLCFHNATCICLTFYTPMHPKSCSAAF